MNDKIRFESLVPELNMIEAEIKGQQYLMDLPDLRGKITWGGAGVIIAFSLPTPEAETVVLTLMAREVAWFFNRVGKVAYDNQLIDSNSKYLFYRKLARRVVELVDGVSPVTDSQAVLMELLGTVRQMSIAWDDADADS